MPSPTANSFPRRPDNRPALSRIGYRIGGYPEIRDAIWRSVNAAPELAEWTHRAPDDPGVALVEVAAIVGDILTFYQEHYANETFLRTATWEESIRELVRLTGYRLGPATAGRVLFAFTVKGEQAVDIPAAFPVKAELKDGDKPVDFLTGDTFSAEPTLGAFHLYRSRTILSGLTVGTTVFEIARVDGNQDPQLRSEVGLKSGDKLMLIPNEPTWLTGGGSVGSIDSSQMVKVKSVETILDRVLVEVENPIRDVRSGTVRAYRVGRTFRHFGHNAPDTRHTSIKSGSAVTGTREYDTDFRRHWHHTCSEFDGAHSLARKVIPLDQEVQDLLIGSVALVQVPISFGGLDRDIMVARKITALKGGPFGLGDMQGSTSFVTLDGNIATNSTSGSPTSDLREVRFHETTSPELQLRRKASFPSGSFTGANQLFHYGTASETAKLIGRTLLLRSDDERFAEVTVVDAETVSPTYARMRQITLNEAPQGFERSDFDEEKPTVAVFGNIVAATQGKLEALAVLGNGDMRETFQSFKLPQAPLTYLHEPSATPSAQPELVIRVDGREWSAVDSFFGRGPQESIYILRHDDDGEAWVQFGDGVTGARLPSGLKNVTAEYRTGVGALGEVKPGTKPTAGAKLDQLDKIFLPGEVTGGSAGEPAENARLNAPPTLQSLGRLVSLADYESEARSLPGAVTAKAAWDIVEGSTVIQIRLLLEQAQQSDAQFEAAAESIRTADRTRGISRYPILITQCELRYVYLTLQYAYDPLLTTTEVETAIRAQLGLSDDEAHERTGVFGRYRRDLGEAEHRLSVAGAVQNAAGVAWCRVVHFGLLAPGDDPTELTRPCTEANVWRAPCAPTELLQLHSLHLTLNPVDS